MGAAVQLGVGDPGVGLGDLGQVSATVSRRTDGPLRSVCTLGAGTADMGPGGLV